MVSNTLVLTLMGLCLVGGSVATCADRQTPGIICETCTGVAVCLNVAGTWTAVEVDKCEAGTFCDSKTGNCTAEPSACNAIGYVDGLLECTSEGIYPNPYDCQSYFVCREANGALTAEKMSCPGNTAFNAVSGQCTLTTSDASCKTLQHKCERAGDQKPWPSNANIYYLCRARILPTRVLYPELYKCDGSGVFNATSLLCETAPVVSPNPGNPSNPPNPDDPAVTPENPTEHTCVGNEYLRDPADCTGYYRCPRRGAKPVHYNCPTGHFNDNTKQCVIGTCQNAA